MAAENPAYESDNKFYDEAVEQAELKKEKFKYFVKEFLLTFKNKEKCLRHIAKCTSRFQSFFQKRNNTYEIPSEMINLMASVPLVSPIINVNIPTASFFSRGFFNAQHFQKAKKIVNTLDKYASQKVEALLAVVARELIRIYEYQLSLIKFNDIETIARHAVDCILVYCCTDDAKVGRNSFLDAIICGELPKKKKKDKFALENGGKWSVFSIFKKPGLRRQIKKDGQGLFEYFTKDNSSESAHNKCNPEKYGFRGEVLQVDEERKQYLIWDYDKRYELQTTNNVEHQKYEPMFLIADTADLLNYTSQIDKDNNKASPKFSNFMAKYYGLQNKIQIVYRQVGQCCEKIDLEGANLSKVDFTYALFHKTRFGNVENVKFYGSLFLFVTFNDISIQSSDFYRANFLFCHFLKVNFGSVNDKFLETKIIYSRYNKIEVNKTSHLISAIFREIQYPENEPSTHQTFLEETEFTEVKSSTALDSHSGDGKVMQNDNTAVIEEIP